MIKQQYRQNILFVLGKREGGGAIAQSAERATNGEKVLG